MIEYTDTGIWVTDEKSVHAYDNGLAEYISHAMLSDAFASVNANPKVIDFGCGTGAYCRKFAEMGIRPTAMDGNMKSESISDFPIQIVDITKPYEHEKVPFGVSIEVGNHVPPGLCDAYLDGMCSKIESLLFLSWARPGQGGSNQLNRLDFDSVAAKLYKRGFMPDYELTYKTRRASGYVWLKDTASVYRRFSS